MSYYRSIEGHKMDAHLLELAEIAGKGTGAARISVQDARTLWDAVKDGGVYTEVEKQTVKYLRENFNWTQAADEWFRRQEANWFSHENPLHMTPMELSKQHFAHDDVLETPAERQARKHRLETAIIETVHDHEEIGFLGSIGRRKRRGSLFQLYRKSLLSQWPLAESNILPIAPQNLLPFRVQRERYQFRPNGCHAGY